MPTNDERREVAARLRKDDVFWNVVKTDIDTYRNYLADLIEPEPERTCEFIPFIEDDGSVFVENCSECDAAVLSRCGFNYCPNCGARVVR